jgi:hypothetical protein
VALKMLITKEWLQKRLARGDEPGGVMAGGGLVGSGFRNSIREALIKAGDRAEAAQVVGSSFPKPRRRS